MKRTIFLISVLCLLLFFARPAAAQPDFSDDLYRLNKVTYEMGTSLGVMNCLTDLGGGKGPGKKFIKDIDPGNSEPTGSIYISGAYRNALVLRTEAVWGIVKASDGLLKSIKDNSGGRYQRNLSFRSNIFELSLVGEIHPRYFKQYRTNEKLPRISPYLLGGIGYFVFNPQAKYDGVWTDLRPLSTEGQGFAEYPDRKPYKLKQINFPVGAGFRYKVSTLINFNFECVYRILNTDYLDDVSTRYVDKNLYSHYFNGFQLTQALSLQDRQTELAGGQPANTNDMRGNSTKNDAYFSFNFKVGFIF
jgi:hypothetical protein